MKTPQYWQALETLTRIAATNQTQFDIDDHPKYGWTSFAFETDKFGGCYLCVGLKYDGALSDTDTQQPVTLAEIAQKVPELRDKMLRERDMAAVSEFVNNEY